MDTALSSIRRASRQRILAATEKVFARHGFDGATMAQLAAAAGLPKANLHYYFGTKETAVPRRAGGHSGRCGWTMPPNGS